MSLDPVLYYALPEDTARVARAAFPKGNVYMRMHDALGALYDNPSCAPVFASRGRPAVAPARLALVTVLQYVEGLSDVQAADAVRSRIDWKYALCLELDDPGFDSAVLSEFRSAGNSMAKSSRHWCAWSGRLRRPSLSPRRQEDCGAAPRSVAASPCRETVRLARAIS